MKYQCRCCGWVYDEDQGELACDIDPNTPFDELPEGFECPECYADKRSFYELEEWAKFTISLRNIHKSFMRKQ